MTENISIEVDDLLLPLLGKQFRLIYQAVNKRNSLDVLLQLIIICLIVV